jgi:hypothetical protein
MAYSLKKKVSHHKANTNSITKGKLSQPIVRENKFPMSFFFQLETLFELQSACINHQFVNKCRQWKQPFILSRNSFLNESF